jgi:hypothetical protein
MDGWWTEIEAAVGAALREHGELSVAELALALDLPESAAASLLHVLAADGRVRIVRIAEPGVRPAGGGARHRVQ